MAKGVKMTGAEFTAFTAADWGPDAYWDDTVFRHNGEEVDDLGTVEPTDEIVILSGIVIFGYEAGAKAECALKFARKWLKSQSHTSITVEVPNGDIATFKADMKARGFKVLACPSPPT
ncbi:hypothetical protein LAV_00175 [Sphingobium phage Lacusarx]|uniref:Uncharacterized protein n=1 Tax=Sphingobium phage Lacusarx TaxID=1980139 RepID=A0A1W6DX11_9CAUD|nr:hypothetical protein FDH44_gp128 [Sphingobium phage Lacusarx]ARK07550.1 hypothetical protein LAV_00175 [Sphingobium phage Lacusarx]